MTRHGLVPLLATSIVGACYSPNDPIGTGDGSADSTSSGTASIGSTDPTAPSTTVDSMDATTPTQTDATEPTEPSTSSDPDSGSTDGGPACGNGALDDDEVCDDGINDGSYDGCLPGCGALGPRCGDDVVQAQEACDDGNEINADGCNVDCLESATVLWTVVFDAPHDDAGLGVAAGLEGDVFVVGYTGTVGQGTNAFTRRLDPDGVELWDESYGAGSAQGVAVDGGGRVYVAGANGNAGWRAVYDEDGALFLGVVLADPANDAAVSPDGNAVVAGTVDYSGGIWARRFSLEGVSLWSSLVPNSGFDNGRGVAVDSTESVLVAGLVDQFAYAANGWLRKYDSNGGVEWTYVFNSSAQPNAADGDNFQAVAVGPMDEIACVGGSGDEPTMDVWVGSFTEDGDLSWSDTQTTIYGGVRGEDVAIDGAGNVIVVATMPTQNDGLTRAWVRKYSPGGVRLWTEEFNIDDADAASTTVEGVAVDATDHIFVVGATSTGGDTDVWVGKLTP